MPSRNMNSKFHKQKREGTGEERKVGTKTGEERRKYGDSGISDVHAAHQCRWNIHHSLLLQTWLFRSQCNRAKTLPQGRLLVHLFFLPLLSSFVCCVVASLCLIFSFFSLRNKIPHFFLVLFRPTVHAKNSTLPCLAPAVTRWVYIEPSLRL